MAFYFNLLIWLVLATGVVFADGPDPFQDIFKSASEILGQAPTNPPTPDKVDKDDKKPSAGKDDCIECRKPPKLPDLVQKPTAQDLETERIINDCAKNVDEDILDVMQDIKLNVKNPCAIKMMPDGKTIDQANSIYENYPPIHYKGRIRKSDRKPELFNKIRLEIHPARSFKAKNAKYARTQEILKKTKECIPEVKRYLKKAGLDVSLDIDSTLEPEPGEPLYTVNVSDELNFSDPKKPCYVGSATNSSNMLNYCFQGGRVQPPGSKVPPITFENGAYHPHRGLTESCLWYCANSLTPGATGQSCEETCEPFRQKEYCLTTSHEVGHLFGLTDEYSYPGCPNRPTATEERPWSMMAYSILGFGDIPADLADLTFMGGLRLGNVIADNVRFMPRHVEKMIAPLCQAVPAPTPKKLVSDPPQEKEKIKDKKKKAADPDDDSDTDDDTNNTDDDDSDDS